MASVMRQWTFMNALNDAHTGFSCDRFSGVGPRAYPGEVSCSGMPPPSSSSFPAPTCGRVHHCGNDLRHPRTVSHSAADSSHPVRGPRRVRSSSHLAPPTGSRGPQRVGLAEDGPHHSCLGPYGQSTSPWSRTGRTALPAMRYPVSAPGKTPFSLRKPSLLSRTFADLGVSSSLLAVLHDAGITTPTPIQSATLPDALSGRDVLGRGRTGSGKTYAFCLPLVSRLAANASGRGRRTRNAPRGLILAPTRELARQIDETLAPLAHAEGLRTTVIFGGVPQGRQVAALDRGVDIVVACPGRLEDLMGQKHIRLDAVEVSVLDEADHMADLGFLPGVTRILSATPADAQRLLFSATLDAGVQKLVTRFLTDPEIGRASCRESAITRAQGDSS